MNRHLSPSLARVMTAIAAATFALLVPGAAQAATEAAVWATAEGLFPGTFSGS
ncbi:MAG: hypothetical protein O7D35_04780 [Acidobacteria bacterium]|nr:hypothetical protein [Acidobacteriota bacterium]